MSAVESGYGDDVCEYPNALYCRNWLHEAWLLLNEHIVQLWTRHIEVPDDRYGAATIEDGTAEPVRGGFAVDPSPDAQGRGLELP